MEEFRILGICFVFSFFFVLFSTQSETLAAIRFVRSLRIAFGGSHGAVLLEKTSKNFYPRFRKSVARTIEGARPCANRKEKNLAAIQFVRSLRIACEGSHHSALLEKLVKISVIGFANRLLVR